VTGSGKTEVYLQAAASALAHRRGVIVLVPEIGLTPQTVSRFVERFATPLRSCTPACRPASATTSWQRLRRGEARICVGPRSAVFAPIANLGLIVVDEEHDSSYKHEGDPRYDARHVAAHRAEIAGALLLGGQRDASTRELRHAGVDSSLPARADGGRLPSVEIVDMRAARGALHERTGRGAR